MKERSESIRNKLPALLALGGLVLFWWLLTLTGWVPEYMLPSPVAVVRAFIGDFPILARHALVSLEEAAAGLLIGILLAFGIAVLMERFLTMESALMPLLVISQTIPTIAIAPLLVLWMGFGVAPKIMLVIITTFFPIAVGTLEGFKSADPDAVALLGPDLPACEISGLPAPFLFRPAGLRLLRHGRRGDFRVAGRL